MVIWTYWASDFCSKNLLAIGGFLFALGFRSTSAVLGFRFGRASLGFVTNGDSGRGRGPLGKKYWSYEKKSNKEKVAKNLF